MYRVSCLVNGKWVHQGDFNAISRANACFMAGLNPEGRHAGRIKVRLAEEQKEKKKG